MRALNTMSAGAVLTLIYGDSRRFTVECLLTLIYAAAVALGQKSTFFDEFFTRKKAFLFSMLQ